MVICLERDADLHVVQLMPLPLTASCFSQIQIGFTFLVPAHLGSRGQRAVKCVCVCVSCQTNYLNMYGTELRQVFTGVVCNCRLSTVNLKLVFRSLERRCCGNHILTILVHACRWTQAASGAAGRANVGWALPCV